MHFLLKSKGDPMSRFIFLFLLFVPLHIASRSLDLEADPDVLIYGDSVQVNSQIDDVYRNVAAGTPVQGSIMITHPANLVVDNDSFTLGKQPLQVEFIRSVPISPYSQLEISIYRFRLEGMTAGVHTLPPVQVMVGAKSFQAPPMTIEVARRSNQSTTEGTEEH
jgi:hypothetical protein